MPFKKLFFFLPSFLILSTCFVSTTHSTKNELFEFSKTKELKKEDLIQLIDECWLKKHLEFIEAYNFIIKVINQCNSEQLKQLKIILERIDIQHTQDSLPFTILQQSGNIKEKNKITEVIFHKKCDTLKKDPILNFPSTFYFIPNVEYIGYYVPRKKSETPFFSFKEKDEDFKRIENFLKNFNIDIRKIKINYYME
jgi:hypothetical protein